MYFLKLFLRVKKEDPIFASKLFRATISNCAAWIEEATTTSIVGGFFKKKYFCDYFLYFYVTATNSTLKRESTNGLR